MKSICLVLVMLAAMVPSLMAASQAEYPRPNLLLDPADLARAASAEHFVILDARNRKAYEQEHIPGARWIDHESWKKAFTEGREPADWSRRIGELGIRPDAKVVVYDDASQKDAARIWWILRYFGLSDVRLLNGTWKLWKAEGLPTSDQQPAPAPSVDFPAEPHLQRLTTFQQLRDSLEQQSLQILDSRSEAEHCGLDPKDSKRAGSIPSAVHLEWSDLLDPKTQRFKSADQLRSLFSKAGVDLARPIVAHCQSGGRSSVMAFALELMGADDARNYYRGWSEWGDAEDAPIVAPETPIRENIEWCDIWVTGADSDKLPKILLVGDSITRGYFQAVEQKLRGQADCARLATSKCVADPAFLEELKLLVGRYPFAVIHFNNGLHGYGYTETQYRHGFQEAVELIRKQAPQATLILASTTPVRERTDLKKLAGQTRNIVEPRNRIAAQIAQEQGIPVDDLYSLGREHPEFFSIDGVHYNEQGKIAQGSQVAAIVAKYLPGQTAPPKPAQ